MKNRLTFPRWSEEQARVWGAQQPWLIGCNYTPAYAINQLEFWQEATFDVAAIESELALAKSLGFNTLRVFLHDLLWSDPSGFLARLDMFLGLSARYGIRPLLVFFDSCWYPFPFLGTQREPERGVHNSGWLQSPGVPILRDPSRFALLEPYVVGVVSHFRDDTRILGWDVWNEPDNPNTSSYGTRDLAEKKAELVLPLLAQTFDWVRSAQPTQPVTCGLWQGDWSEARLSEFGRLCRDGSDVLSFHSYGRLPDVETCVAWLGEARPLLCTEYMARGSGSTFQEVLPYFKEHQIGAYNWGFVQGKTQTHLPWDSWRQPYQSGEPPVWFHELFRPDHTPYRPEEVALIRALTEANP